MTILPDWNSEVTSNLLQEESTTLTLTGQEYAEKFMSLQLEDKNYTHELSAAQLWAIKQDGSFHLLSAHPDVYQLLEDRYDLFNYIGIIIHTTGWAAPLNENGDVDTAPSAHSQRRRVALASCVTNNSVGSVLSFADDKEMISDPGSATGSLAEALVEFWERNLID